MRKAQNAMKIGLKLGAFAALAVSLSSCLIIVDDGSPSVSGLVSQSTFCDGAVADTGASTTIDFKFSASNITIDNLQVVMTAIGESGDANLSDPLTDATKEGPNGSTNIATIERTRLSGTGTIRGSTNLKMDKNNRFAPAGSVSLTSIKPNATVPGNSKLRLWVRASYNGGKLTSWMKSGNETGLATDAGCDPQGI
jgi:hypothetical protein